ncbi:S8 family serine peptidase [Thiorhodococcus fuscus]|uniref:S8 family serine peptidase n=1 Tax=Thiorhodococcus fuscus TaxID=527200 RepID=UPI0036DC492D
MEYYDQARIAGADDQEVEATRRLQKEDVLYGAQALGVEEVRDYSQLPMNVLRVQSLEAVDALRTDPRVKAVHENGANYLQLNESLPLIDQPEGEALGADGAGTTVAVLDTGADYTRSAFGSCSSPGGSCKIVVAMDFAPDDGSLDDDDHGTNVSAIVLGVAPQAKVAALDVFRQVSGGLTAYDTDILSALNWVLANRATYNIVAVNMSLGGSTMFSSPCASSSYSSVIASLKSAGILTAIASGNSGYKSGIASPACTPGAVSVGAVYDSDVGGPWTWGGGTCTDSSTAADQVTCFSNSASYLSLLAPGAMIVAAGIEQGGTSQASPHVAGAAAALKAYCSSANPDNILSALQTSGKPVTDSRNGITKPRIDLDAAANSLAATLGDCTGGGVTDSYVLSVSKVGSGTVTSSPSGISCGSTCSASFSSGTAVTLAATPSSGYSFSGWGGACSGTGSCLVTMNAAKSVAASFTASGSTLPDLVVTTVTAPASGEPGGTLSVTASVRNQGTATSGSFWFGYLFSTDSRITGSDVDANWGCAVSSLTPGSTYTCYGDLPIPSTLAAGTYYVGAYGDLDSEVAESNEVNNGLAASNSTVIGSTSHDAGDYYRKVNAYFLGVLGRSATAQELADWGDVLLDYNGSVWKPAGIGLQLYLSSLKSWGADAPAWDDADLMVRLVLGNLFGSYTDIHSAIRGYYVEGLVYGYVKPKGLVNAVLNDLAIMPRADGTYGQPNGWQGGPGTGLLTASQIAAYKALVESLATN